MENTEVELDNVRSPEAQAIIDAENGVVPEIEEEKENDLSLPSDEGRDEEYEEVLYAGKYKSQEELVKGIKNIGSNLPEYVINGMTPEALEQHYKEIRKDFSSGNKDRKHAATTKEEEKPEEEKLKVDKKPAAVSDELWTELDAQFSTDGNITAEQYDKLNAQGIPDVVIDKYLDGLKSEQTAFTEKVYNIAGGEEEYATIKEWAEENLSSAELNAVSSMKDYGQITMAMEGIKARYDAANSNAQPKTIRGNRTSGKASGYTSEAEYLRDVSDIRYSTDTVFRDKVKNKMSRSNLTS